ncbi:ROK family transcriptional regulator [Ornithinimicrobium pekingense]|uniref:Sugar kinase n=1 Tax=Ornithinimicrobium pekingense TaxID=384677 RepID=A0ABQ2FC33_9MICO|nr:ROK family protein [Ornithinimicrobium pekingense]GGK79956.1 sugar kinase [Ornithinimicrobium pekingense]
MVSPPASADAPVTRSVAPSASSAGSLFQLLRDGAPRTRADLVAASGMARSTVAGRIDELLATGLVAPTGEASSSGGRPAVTFVFDPSSRVVVGVDLGVSHAHVAVTDLTNQVLAEDLEDLQIADGPAAVLQRVTAMALRLLERAGRSLDDVAGTGIGLPGPVEFSSGRPVSPPVMPGWDRFDVPGFLGRTLPGPVLVDNDVNIMALGEHAERYRDVADLVFVKVASGIGAGIISGGALQRGAQGAAGDLGHVAVPDGNQTLCTCGNRGCLEAVASGAAVARRLREAGADVQTQSDVVALVRAGDTAAIQAVRDAGREIGSVLAGVVSLLNPSVMVVGGRISSVGEQLLAGIRESVYRRSLPLGTHHLRIVGSVSGMRAGIVGASVLVTDTLLSADGVDAVVARRS